jgi:hypothetical protein
MKGKYEIGQQPCSDLTRQWEANVHGQWLNVHECYRCEKTVTYCENCRRDHHEDGYETCKPSTVGETA